MFHNFAAFLEKDSFAAVVFASWFQSLVEVDLKFLSFSPVKVLLGSRCIG